MKVVVTGSGGAIGSALVDRLRAEGHEVLRLVRRRPKRPDERRWWPKRGLIEDGALEGADAVVHLAGDGLLGLWTKDKKRKIERSRVRGTRALAKAIRAMERPPALLAASAVGYYGKKTKGPVDESARPGKGFLARVARRTEEAASLAADRTRVVHLRFGVVLDRDEGALALLVPLFESGLGAKLGRGRHHFPWVHVDDVTRAIAFLLAGEHAGPFNVVAPRPVTNARFTRALAERVKCRARLRAPERLVRLAFAGLADEVLLASQRAAPTRLLDAGFEFEHPSLRGALRHLV